jgi:DNA sulfur modification protein DndD
VIFDKLTLCNFGAYRGEHSVVLTPPSKSRPIVLFGGMNGAGKTTLLDALQLAFYGKLAKCSNRGSRAYEEFLALSMNRYAEPDETAFIELDFRHQYQGAARRYTVRRSWWLTPTGAKESVEVAINGIDDQTIADAWPEYAEDLIPSRLAHLFFFDGEKIEALADRASAAELLRAGIHSLLGLDMVDRLGADLRVLVARKAKEAASSPENALKVSKLSDEVKVLEIEDFALFEQHATLTAKLEHAQHAAIRVETRLSGEGGEIYRQKHALTSAKENLQRELSELDGELRDLAADALPLALVSNLLDGVLAESKDAAVAARSTAVEQILAERDANLVAHLGKAKLPKPFIEECRAFLAKDRKSRQARHGTTAQTTLSADALASLAHLQRTGLPHLVETARRKCKDRKRILNRLAESERLIKSVPDEEAIQPLLFEAAQARAAVIALETDLAAVAYKKSQTEALLLRKKVELDRAVRQSVEDQLNSEEAIRITEYSNLAQSVLATFRTRIIEKHLGEVQELILSSLQHLLRKKRLVRDLTIDPKSFEINLIGSDEKVIRPERLSAGERQLLAVSMLWGLAKACRRPLPAVIDTPLGRLDSEHRGRLVDRYFPNASHQVLLLSTDEEIRGSYVKSLAPAIGHHYTIEFSEISMSTSIRAGYFD